MNKDSILKDYFEEDAEVKPFTDEEIEQLDLLSGVTKEELWDENGNKLNQKRMNNKPLTRDLPFFDTYNLRAWGFVPVYELGEEEKSIYKTGVMIEGCLWVKKKGRPTEAEIEARNEYYRSSTHLRTEELLDKNTRKDVSVIDKRARYTREQRTKLVVAYMHSKNIKMAAEISGIRINTAKVYRHQNWFLKAEEKLKKLELEKLDSIIQSTFKDTLSQLQDRIAHGDYAYDPKTGEMRKDRVQISSKDAANIAMSLNKISKDTQEKIALLDPVGKIQEKDKVMNFLGQIANALGGNKVNTPPIKDIEDVSYSEVKEEDEEDLDLDQDYDDEDDLDYE